MARPNKYETHVAPRLGEIADWVRNGATEREIAERLDIAMSSFCEYKRVFSEFSELLKKTRDAVDGEVENALLQSALNGNTTAQIFWLKNRQPKKWRDKPAEETDDTETTVNEFLLPYAKIVYAYNPPPRRTQWSNREFPQMVRSGSAVLFNSIRYRYRPIPVYYSVRICVPTCADGFEGDESETAWEISRMTALAGMPCFCATAA